MTNGLVDTMLSPAHLLAQTEPATSGGFAELISRAAHGIQNGVRQLDILNRPDELLTELEKLPLIGASVIVTVGILCVFNGYRWHKWVVVVLAFLGGIALGRVVGAQMESGTVIAASLGILCAIIATPMLKVAVAIFGGLTGAFVGSNLWTAMQAGPAEAHWAGAMMGFILLAMASLVMFRLVIVLFTSIGGSAMVVFGGIALLLSVEGWREPVVSSLTANKGMVPLLLAVAAVGGFVLQESRVREECKADAHAT